MSGWGRARVQGSGRGRKGSGPGPASFEAEEPGAWKGVGKSEVAEPSHYLAVTFGSQDKSVCCEGDRDDNSTRYGATGDQDHPPAHRERKLGITKTFFVFSFYI